MKLKKVREDVDKELIEEATKEKKEEAAEEKAAAKKKAEEERLSKLSATEQKKVCRFCWSILNLDSLKTRPNAFIGTRARKETRFAQDPR